MTVALVRPRLALVAVAAGCAVLTARPLLLAHATQPVTVVVVLFLSLLLVGVAWPGTRPAPKLVGPVLVIGVAAFALGRLFGGPSGAPVAGRLVVLNILAAVAEEAFFRRLVFGVLAANGAGSAIIGSAVLFATVHVTVYGAWVLPVDLAAGLVLSWQRWASGTWRVPALTHVVANLLVVI